MAEVEQVGVERYSRMFQEAETHPDYWIDGPISEFTEDVARLMKEKDVSRAELARRMGTSRAYITKMLGGDANFTLLTMVKLAMALDGAVHIHIADKRAITRWQDTVPGAGGKRIRKRVRKPRRPPAPEPEAESV